MDYFKYKILLKNIDSLTTKKSKIAMQQRLLEEGDIFSFRALTYLIKKYSNILNISTVDSNIIKNFMLELVEDSEYSLEYITEFCDSDYTISEFHYEKLVDSRYTTFQLAAYIAKHVTKKE